MELQPELHLPRSGGSAGDCSGRAGYARWSKDDQIGRIEIRAVQEVEDFRAELQTQAFTEGDVLQNGKVPGGETRADVRVSADVAVESAGGWGPYECIRIEPLAGLTEDHGAAETGIQERPYGISRVAIVRGVVTQLRSEWES